jgi:cytochrome o ubiquinol oxidase subunit II
VRALLLLVSLLSGCSGGVLDTHGPVGDAERTILFNATIIMLAVVVPVIIGTLAFAWWFRVGNKRARRRPDWSYGGQIEFVVWAIPALVVLFLGGIAWIGAHDLDPKSRLRKAGNPVEIEVVSLDWKWLFIYPGSGLAAVNRLVVPVGAPLHFRLTSAGVMNSFFVPQLGSQIYTMAGMATELNLQADKSGSYAGLSAQFSGDGFSDMRFEVTAVSPDAYARWVDEAHAHGGSLNPEQYALLAQPSSHEQPRTFGAVSAGLFDAILATPGTPPRGHAP